MNTKHHLLIYRTDREDGGLFGRIAIPCEHKDSINDAIESIRGLLESPEFIVDVSYGKLFYMSDATMDLENRVVKFKHLTIAYDTLEYVFANSDGECAYVGFNVSWLEVYECVTQ